MDKDVEQIIYYALTELQEKFPKTVQAVVKHKPFVTLVHAGNQGDYVMIDFTEKMNLRMSLQYYQDRSMELYDRFATINKWYAT